MRSLRVMRLWHDGLITDIWTGYSLEACLRFLVHHVNSGREWVEYADQPASLRMAYVSMDDTMNFSSRTRLATCCNGSDPACPAHGVAASNARQDAYWKRVGGHE